MEIPGKVAVVTGGAGSIGAVVARALAGRGATVARWDVDSDDPDVISCNVADADAVEAAFDTTSQRWGTPSILINAAGVSGGRSPWAPDVVLAATEPFSVDAWRGVLSLPESWQITYGVNVLGVVNTSRSFARRVSQARGTGSIVNITSMGGDSLADPELTAYCASKAAANQITRICAASFAQLGIRVNAVAPGIMADRMKPSGVAQAKTYRVDPPDVAEIGKKLTPLENRSVRPSDIADAIMGLLHADFVTGQIVTVDGGLTLRSSPLNQTRPTLDYLVAED